tara:strand:- start:884 stop:1123 length:240 start_codon:yes stop_codon:yes gene_type:complete
MKITKKILENLIKEEIEKMNIQVDENELEKRQMDALPGGTERELNAAYQDRNILRKRIEKLEDILTEKFDLPRGFWRYR